MKLGDTADIVVIGGGCHGTSIARHLARRGAGKVVLLEKFGIASGATQWSSANIRLHYQIETLARMALFGREMFRNFEERVGGESGWRNNGYVVLLPEEEIEPARMIVEMQQRIGIDARMISVDEIADMLPGMSLDGVAGGCTEPDSGQADGALTANSFADAARREGADLRIGPEVGEVTAVKSSGDGVRVITSDGVIESGTAVLAAGFRSAGLLAPHGVELPITPVRHTIAIVERVEEEGLDDSHPTISDQVQLGYYRPSGPGLTLIGAHDPLEGDVDADVETSHRPQAEPPATGRANGLAGGPVLESVSRPGRGTSAGRLHGGCTTAPRISSLRWVRYRPFPVSISRPDTAATDSNSAPPSAT